VEEASDGARAIESVVVSAPDAVLLDLTMPGLSGFDVLGGLRQVLGLARLPVLVLTSSTDGVDRARAAELGADDYLTKPIIPERILSRLGAALKRNSLKMTGAIPLRVVGL
jgi:two-component system KDP operon response regulator KdpE